MSTTTSPEAVRKLLDNMQTDLHSLSMECKKKFPPVKEAAESGIVKIKTIAARNTDILAALKENSSEVSPSSRWAVELKSPKSPSYVSLPFRGSCPMTSGLPTLTHLP